MKKVLSTLALASLVTVAHAQTSYTNDITTNTTWTGEVVLENTIFVRDGATLTILPGTIVRGQPRTGPVVANQTAGSPGALIVTQTGRIVANGTRTNPIIFTTAAIDQNGDGVADSSGGFETKWVAGSTFLDNAPKTAPLAPLNTAGLPNNALWGGVVILGNAPTNNANIAGVGFGKTVVEGLSVPGYPVAYATYGGYLPHDNSGSMTFASIRHAGDEIGNSNELNGLTLGGVGDATRIENIEIYCNFDDGIEWFGGTVNGKYLAVFFVGDDAFDLDEGYTGTNQFLFAIAPFFLPTGYVSNDSTTFYGTVNGDKLGEFDGENYRPDNTTFNNNLSYRVGYDNATDLTPFPLSNPAVWNFTGIGKELQASPHFTPTAPLSILGTSTNRRGIQFRNGFAGSVFNSVVFNTGTETGFEVNNGATSPTGFSTDNNANNGLILVGSSSFKSTATINVTTETAVSTNGNAFVLRINGVASANNYAPGGSLLNSDITFDPRGNAAGKLNTSLKPTKINPRPTGLGFTGIAPQGNGLDRTATYRGAFPTSTLLPLWTTGWTALNVGGILAN